MEQADPQLENWIQSSSNQDLEQNCQTELDSRNDVARQLNRLFACRVTFPCTVCSLCLDRICSLSVSDIGGRRPFTIPRSYCVSLCRFQRTLYVFVLAHSCNYLMLDVYHVSVGHTKHSINAVFLMLLDGTSSWTMSLFDWLAKRHVRTHCFVTQAVALFYRLYYSFGMQVSYIRHKITFCDCSDSCVLAQLCVCFQFG